MMNFREYLPVRPLSPLSAYDPLVQMALSENKICFLKCMWLKTILGVVKGSVTSVWRNIYEPSWISVGTKIVTCIIAVLAIKILTSIITVLVAPRANEAGEDDAIYYDAIGDTVPCSHNEAGEDDAIYYDAIGDTVPCSHNESCLSDEKICTPSSKWTAALQLSQQDDMFNGGNHVGQLIADGSFADCKATVTSIHMENIKTGIDCKTALLSPARSLQGQNNLNNIRGLRGFLNEIWGRFLLLKEEESITGGSSSTPPITSTTNKDVCHEPADIEPKHRRETVLADEDCSPCDIGQVVEEMPVMDGAALMANPAHRFVLDSGATIHATNILEVFSEGDFNMVGTELEVIVADGRPLQIHGQGSVDFGTFKLLNVKYVPGLRTNIVSVIKLMEIGYSINFEGRQFVIGDATGVTIARGWARDELPELWPVSS